MKEPKIIGAVIVVLVVGLGAGGVWWFSQSPSSRPAAATPMEAHEISTAPAMAPPPPSVLSPASAPAPSAVVATAAAPTGRPPAQLQTVIQEISRLIKAGDLGTVQKNYRPPAPAAQLTAQDQATLNQLAQGAGMPEVFAMLGQELDAIKDQTPTYNDAGDRATFHAPKPANMQGTPGPRPVVFTKVNGQWYLDSSASPDFWVLF